MTDTDLFYKQLAEASDCAAEDGYLAENEPWISADLVDLEDEERFWR